MHKTTRLAPTLAVLLSEMRPWAATVPQIREVVQAWMVVGTGSIEDLPLHARRFVTTRREVETAAQQCHEAVRTGRLFDFGRWSNDVIIYGGNKGGPLYHRNRLALPFRQPWMFSHHWEPLPKTWSTSVYLVEPLEPDRKQGGGAIEVTELQPAILRDTKALIISDRGVLYPDENPEGAKYHCAATPAVWRYLPEFGEAMNEGKSPEAAAAGNVLDPLMTALLILNTKGITQTTIAVDAKLQKARAKNGKPSIPPYVRVQSEPYVTRIQGRIEKGRRADGQGTHASPTPHIRIGHTRVLASGKRVMVREAAVNSEGRQHSRRSHYEVRP